MLNCFLLACESIKQNYHLRTSLVQTTVNKLHYRLDAALGSFNIIWIFIKMDWVSFSKSLWVSYVYTEGQNMTLARIL